MLAGHEVALSIATVFSTSIHRDFIRTESFEEELGVGMMVQGMLGVGLISFKIKEEEVTEREGRGWD